MRLRVASYESCRASRCTQATYESTLSPTHLMQQLLAFVHPLLKLGLPFVPCLPFATDPCLCESKKPANYTKTHRKLCGFGWVLGRFDVETPSCAHRVLRSQLLSCMDSPMERDDLLAILSSRAQRSSLVKTWKFWGWFNGKPMGEPSKMRERPHFLALAYMFVWDFGLILDLRVV